ncbi:MAG: dephospho-CoA kinase [Gammaproteobacteria bacterium]
MKKMLRIGLTGGIASGKSTVSNMFRSLGVPVIDADEIVREISRPGEPAYDEIIALFGNNIVNEEGYLRRDLIKDIIFKKTELKNKLENIIHPRVRDEIEERIASSNYPYCILSIPLLLETGADYGIDRILVIDAPVKIQLKRIIKRDGISEDLALSIIESQIDRQERLSSADDIIVNTGDTKHLEREVAILHRKYLDLASTYETVQQSSSERSVNIH